MTKGQRISLMAELWPNACRSQGWRAEDRDLRLSVCSIAVFCDDVALPMIRNILQFRDVFSGGVPMRVLKSTNEIDGDKEFTRVKGLLLMLADDLRGPLAGNDSKARQKRYVIREQMRCIALYHPNAAGYVAAIIRDRFGRGRVLPPDIDDLTDAPTVKRDGSPGRSQLDQVLATLNDRLHNKRTGFRVKAGHSIHLMHMRAGTKCFCKECEEQRTEAPIRVPAIRAPLDLGMAPGEDPDWNV